MMTCPKCGGEMLIRKTLAPSAVSVAMNEQRRERECPNGHRTDTVEIERAELQRWRQAAHMGLRGAA